MQVRYDAGLVRGWEQIFPESPSKMIYSLCGAPQPTTSPGPGASLGVRALSEAISLYLASKTRPKARIATLEHF